MVHQFLPTSTPATRWRAAARCAIVVLLGVFLSGCLLDAQFKTANVVFTPAEAVVPEAIAGTYGVSESEGGGNAGYLQFIPLGERRFAAQAVVLVAAEDGKTREWHAQLYEGFFVPLADSWFVFVQHDEDGQGHTLVRIDEAGIGLLPVSEMDQASRDRLTAVHGIQMANAKLISGTVARTAMVGFLDDLRRHLEPQAQMLPKVESIPREVLEAAYANLGPVLAAASPEDFSPAETVASILAIARDLDERGIAWGSYILARLYGNGWGVEQDFAETRRYAEQAVGRGLERAKHVLAFLAFNGFGEPKDEQKGLTLFRAAADAGEPRSMFALSDMYLRGAVVGQDTQLGLAWLEKAAAGGLPEAAFELGRRYLFGDGVAQDDAAAVQWLDKAVGYSEADVHLGWMYAAGRGVAADQARASQLYLSAARDGQHWAQWQIGERLIAGTGIAPDREAGMAWIRKAADAGLAEAKEALEKYKAPTVVASRGVGGRTGSAKFDERLYAEIFFLTVIDEEEAKSDAWLAGIHSKDPIFRLESDIAFGSEDAPITVLSYVSLDCANCAQWREQFFIRLNENLVARGTVRHVVRFLPLSKRDYFAAMLATCALAPPGQQPKQSPEMLIRLFRAIGQNGFDPSRESPTEISEVSKDRLRQLGRMAGIGNPDQCWTKEMSDRILKGVEELSEIQDYIPEFKWVGSMAAPLVLVSRASDADAITAPLHYGIFAGDNMPTLLLSHIDLQLDQMKTEKEVASKLTELYREDAEFEREEAEFDRDDLGRPDAEMPELAAKSGRIAREPEPISVFFPSTAIASILTYHEEFEVAAKLNMLLTRYEGLPSDAQFDYEIVSSTHQILALLQGMMGHRGENFYHAHRHLAPSDEPMQQMIEAMAGYLAELYRFHLGSYETKDITLIGVDRLPDIIRIRFRLGPEDSKEYLALYWDTHLNGITVIRAETKRGLLQSEPVLLDDGTLTPSSMWIDETTERRFEALTGAADMTGLTRLFEDAARELRAKGE